MTWWMALVLFSAGVGWGVIVMLVVSWVMWRTAGHREGFLTDPKGEAFTIRDGLDAVQGFPEEPTKEENAVLQRTERFLKVLEDRA